MIGIQAWNGAQLCCGAGDDRAKIARDRGRRGLAAASAEKTAPRQTKFWFVCSIPTCEGPFSRGAKLRQETRTTSKEHQNYPTSTYFQFSFCAQVP